MAIIYHGSLSFNIICTVHTHKYTLIWLYHRVVCVSDRLVSTICGRMVFGVVGGGVCAVYINYVLTMYVHISVQTMYTFLTNLDNKKIYY